MDWKLGGLTLLLLASPAAAQNITDDVDRFTGSRVLGYTAKGQAQLGLPILSIKVETSPEKTFGSLKFMVSPKLDRYAAQSMRYLGCHNVDWIVDGTPMQLGITAHSARRIERTLIEFIGQEITLEQMAKIGAAGKVEYRICRDEFALRPVDLTAFREIAGRLGQLSSKPQPAEPAGNMGWKPKF